MQASSRILTLPSEARQRPSGARALFPPSFFGYTFLGGAKKVFVKLIVQLGLAISAAGGDISIFSMDELDLLQRSMKGEYVEDIRLRLYIWKNYRHVLTEREKALHHASVLEIKATHAEKRSDFSATRLRNIPGYFFDADVAAITKTQNGLSLFVQQCCEHLLRDYADQIFINRCERCNRIVASPIACACLWCGHHWYERRQEMVARAASAIYPRSE